MSPVFTVTKFPEIFCVDLVVLKHSIDSYVQLYIIENTSCGVRGGMKKLCVQIECLGDKQTSNEKLQSISSMTDFNYEIARKISDASGQTQCKPKTHIDICIHKSTFFFLTETTILTNLKKKKKTHISKICDPLIDLYLSLFGKAMNAKRTSSLHFHLQT